MFFEKFEKNFFIVFSKKAHKKTIRAYEMINRTFLAAKIQFSKNFNSWTFKIMALENFKPKYLFNQGKQVAKFNKTYILKAIWTRVSKMAKVPGQDVMWD